MFGWYDEKQVSYHEGVLGGTLLNSEQPPICHHRALRRKAAELSIHTIRGPLQPRLEPRSLVPEIFGDFPGPHPRDSVSSGCFGTFLAEKKFKGPKCSGNFGQNQDLGSNLGCRGPTIRLSF